MNKSIKQQPLDHLSFAIAEMVAFKSATSGDSFNRTYREQAANITNLMFQLHAQISADRRAYALPLALPTKSTKPFRR